MKYLNTRGHRNAWRILVLSALAFAWPVDANAQWTVIKLHPTGTSQSWAIGVGDGQQVGHATVDGVNHAGLWSGRANSWVDLHPVGMDWSQARSVDGGQQVGSAMVGGLPRASLWSSTAGSWVDLTPYWADATQSVGSGVGGGEQVGSATFADGVTRASLWTGTAASWVDLTPFGATSSRISATDGVQQVGSATVGGVLGASLWNGSAGSWVDLNPAGARASWGTGVGDGQQVGYTWFGDAPSASHASLWSGTAESWVDLSPAGTSNWSSFAYAVHGGQQVGGVGFRASLWSGTAESWVDLHAFLPRQFQTSMALGIWHDATHTYVVGRGDNSRTGRMEALMWRADNAPPPECGGPADCDDGDPCTDDDCFGGVCFNDPVGCGPADGCCGPDCNSGNDDDCPSCGAKNDSCTVDEDCCSNDCKPNGRCR